MDHSSRARVRPEISGELPRREIVVAHAGGVKEKPGVDGRPRARNPGVGSLVMAEGYGQPKEPP